MQIQAGCPATGANDPDTALRCPGREAWWPKLFPDGGPHRSTGAGKRL